MYHPGIDVSKMSDEDLLTAVNKCYNMMAGSQHNPSLYSSIQLMLNTYETEYQERMFRSRIAEDNKKNPVGTIEIGSIEDISAKGTE